MSKPSLIDRLSKIKFLDDLQGLTGAEAAFRRQMEKTFKGYDLLAISFMKFFIETVVTYNTAVVPHVKESISSEHMLFVEKLVHTFKGLRAARLTAHNGY